MKRLKKILLIDDDEITCFLEKSLLEDLEVAEEIVCIDGGHEALEYIQECLRSGSSPSLIFLDINMPGMDGFEFLERLDSLEVLKSGKLIL